MGERKGEWEKERRDEWERKERSERGGEEGRKEELS